MQEVEIKLRVLDRADVLERLRALGWVARGPRTLERNFVFDTAAGELRASRRVLRVRSFGEDSVLTLKIPVGGGGGAHKVMEEHEVSVSDSSVMVEILEGLGFLRSWRYEKFRTYFGLVGVDGEICLDETPIGDFVELEGDAAWIDSMAAALGYSSADYVTASYGALFAAYRLGHPEIGEQMVFGGSVESC